MIGMEILKHAVSTANVAGRRNLALASTRFAAKKSSSGGASKSSSSSGGGGGAAAIQVPDPPSIVFRKPQTDKIGPGASKDGDYKNPEYFSYHDMSYFDLDVVMKDRRLPQPSSKSK